MTEIQDQIVERFSEAMAAAGADDIPEGPMSRHLFLHEDEGEIVASIEPDHGGKKLIAYSFGFAWILEKPETTDEAIKEAVDLVGQFAAQTIAHAGTVMWRRRPSVRFEEDIAADRVTAYWTLRVFLPPDVAARARQSLFYRGEGEKRLRLEQDDAPQEHPGTCASEPWPENAARAAGATPLAHDIVGDAGAILAFASGEQPIKP